VANPISAATVTTAASVLAPTATTAITASSTAASVTATTDSFADDPVSTAANTSAVTAVGTPAATEDLANTVSSNGEEEDKLCSNYNKTNNVNYRERHERSCKKNTENETQSTSRKSKRLKTTDQKKSR